ncbi:MAG: hypothetical protein Q7V05_02440 [Methanoregula sp.]|nr:hypothetical protein [Methanoregula sp.]
MTDNKQKNRTGRSFVIIPERRSDGIAGPSRTVPGDESGAIDDCNVNNPEQDVEFLRTAQRLIERNASSSGAADAEENIQQEGVKIINTDQQLVERNASGAADAGQENNQQLEMKIKDTPPRLVERATALRGLSICSAKDSKSTCRKRTERDLHSPYAEVPYVKTEQAIRALVCSLMERQDRMNEEIFLKLNDLKYRFDDLELSKKSRTTKHPGTGNEARK